MVGDGSIGQWWYHIATSPGHRAPRSNQLSYPTNGLPARLTRSASKYWLTWHEIQSTGSFGRYVFFNYWEQGRYIYIYIYSSKVIPISLDRQLAVSTGHLCRERLFLRLWDGSPLYPLTQKISGHLAELSRFLWCRTWSCVEIFGVPLADWPTTPSWWSRSIPSLHRDSYPSTPGWTPGCG